MTPYILHILDYHHSLYIPQYDQLRDHTHYNKLNLVLLDVLFAIHPNRLMYAMQTLRHCFIVAHVHDELIIEADPRMSLEAVCEQMGRTPPWAPGLQLRADGYTTDFYKKD